MIKAASHNIHRFRVGLFSKRYLCATARAELPRSKIGRSVDRGLSTSVLKVFDGKRRPDKYRRTGRTLAGTAMAITRFNRLSLAGVSKRAAKTTTDVFHKLRTPGLKD